jgi:hypothetical protein
VVAGQPVAISASTPFDANNYHVGDWVDVSGLRDPRGQIVATRLDRREPGPVTVRGTLEKEGDRYRVGDLTVALPPQTLVEAGLPVEVQGSYQGETLALTRLEPDLFATDPVALFTPTVNRFFIETYARYVEGEVIARTALAGGRIGAGQAAGILELNRRSDGSLAVSRSLELPYLFGGQVGGFIPRGPVPANGSSGAATGPGPMRATPPLNMPGQAGPGFTPGGPIGPQGGAPR